MTMTLVAPRTAPKVTGIPKSGLMLLVGDTKSGKTWLAADFPGAYVIELEHKRGDRIPHGRIDDVVQQYYDYVDECKKKGEEPIGRDAWLLDAFGELLHLAIDSPEIQTVVLDSADEVARLISQEIARANNVEFIGQAKKDINNQALWGEYFERIKGLTDFLKECGKLVIIVCHRKEAKLDKDNHIVKPAGINVSGQGGDYLAKQAEIIGFMDVRNLGGKSTHILTFKGESQRAIWRSGVEELADKEIPIRKDSPYQSFAAAFVPQKKAEAPSLKPAPAKTTNGGKKR